MDALAPATDADRAIAARPQLQRVEGRVRLTTKPGPETGATALDAAHQEGSFKLKFPRTYGLSGLEAVLLNTAGGLTDGDRFSVEARAAPGTELVLTTQAAERIYRARLNVEDAARLDVRLEAGADASLAWLPQETILYDGGRVRRTLDVQAAGSARILLCETVILGRTAHGETVEKGLISDHWRVRRDGRLVYADALKIGGAIKAAAAGAATLGGGRAFASLLWMSADAEERLDDVRATFDQSGVSAGASAWDGLLAIRLVASDAARLRSLVAEVAELLIGRLPRVWAI